MTRLKRKKNNNYKNKGKKNEKLKNLERKKVLTIICRTNLGSKQAAGKRTHRFKNSREIKTILETTQTNERS